MTWDRFAWQRALNKTDLSSSAKLVGSVLMSYANGGGLAWPSQPTIAADASLTRNPMKTAIAQLEEGGWIVKRPRQKTGGTGWEYQLQMPEGSADDPGSVSDPQEGHQQTPRGSDTDPQGVSSRPSGGEQQTPNRPRTTQRTTQPSPEGEGEIYDRLRTQIETFGRPEVPKPMRMHPDEFATAWRTASRGARWVKTRDGDLLNAILVFWQRSEIERALNAVRDFRECKYPVSKLTSELVSIAESASVAGPAPRPEITAADVAAWELM